MDRIDLETAVRELDRAVAEKGEDFIYAFEKRDSSSSDVFSMVLCNYTRRDPDSGEIEPGCIVGMVLAACGFPVQEMHRTIGIIREVARNRSLPIDGDALLLLQDVQGLQDDGYMWGDAVREAKEKRGVNAKA